MGSWYRTQLTLSADDLEIAGNSGTPPELPRDMRRGLLLMSSNLTAPTFTFKLYLGKAVCAICLLLDEYEDRKKPAGRCKGKGPTCIWS